MLCLLVLSLLACDQKQNDEEMTIVVREDNRRINEEKTRLENERQQIQRLKQQLDETEQNIRKMSGKGQSSEAIKAALANLRRVQATQDKLFDNRQQELEARERRLDSKRDTVSGAEATAQTGLDDLRQGQSQLRQDMGSLRSSMQDISQQLRVLLTRINSQPASTAAPRVVPSGGKVVPRRVVDKAYKAAQKRLRARGLKVRDLQGFEKHPSQIRAALKAGDTALAHDLVKQYSQAIKSTKIDASFIQRKMSWVNQMLAGTKLSPSARQRKDGLLQRATQRFTDGRFARANEHLNRIIELVQ